MERLVTLHMWVGTCASLMLVIMALTGLILDHREQFSPSGRVKITNTLALARGTRIKELPVSPSRALHLAFAHADAGGTIQRLALRKMGRGLVYRLETQTKEQIYIDPVTGAVSQDSRDTVDIVHIAKMLHTGKRPRPLKWRGFALPCAGQLAMHRCA